MMLFSTIPMELLYAIPLLPLGLFFFYVQFWASKVTKGAMNSETSHTAAEVAQKMLASAKLGDIVIEEWDNYSENRYEPKEKKIFLSPDAFTDKDVSAISMASREVALAMLDRAKPGLLDLWKKTSTLFTCSYWVVASVLLFGFLTASVVTIWVGYALSIVSIALLLFNLSFETQVRKISLQQMEAHGVIDEQNRSEFDDALKANAVLW